MNLDARSNTSERNRSLRLDLLKILAIFLVCYYHSEPLILHKAPPSAWDGGTLLIYFFHALPVVAVPLFFMVNGALLLNRPLNLSKHLRKTFRLFLLMLLWSFLSNLIVMLLKGDPLSLKEIVSGAQKLKVGYNNHLWFLRAMLMVYLLHPLLKLAFDRIEDRGPLYLALGAAALFSFGQVSFGQALDLVGFAAGKAPSGGQTITLFADANPFGVYAYALTYYLMGGLIARTRVGPWVPALALSLGWLMLFAYGLGKSLSQEAWFDTVFFCYSSVFALAMTAGLFLSLGREWRAEAAAAWATRLGAGTLGIYLIHPLLNAALVAHAPGVLGAFSVASVAGLAVYAALLVAASFAIAECVLRLPVLRESLRV